MHGTCMVNRPLLQFSFGAITQCRAKALSYFRLSIASGDLDTKKTTPNIDVCPESLGTG